MEVKKSSKKRADIKTITKGIFNLYSNPNTKPRSKALKPYIPSLIKRVLKLKSFARKLLIITAINPHNPINGLIKVTIMIISAKLLFKEKNI